MPKSRTKSNSKSIEEYNKRIEEEQKEEEERLRREGPHWLQGAWKLKMTDDNGHCLGYMYEVFNHGTSKSYIRGSLVSERNYTISGNMVVYESGHYQLDNGREILIGANGQNFTKVSNDVNFIPNYSNSSNFSSSSSSQNYSSSSKGYRFSSPQDVIGWLAGKAFYNGSRRLRIRPDGVWLNDYCATFAPTVERWESWKGLIRANTATGQRLSFLIDPIHGQVTDETGDVFSLR